MDRNTALLFSGQGAQEPGMGRELAEQDSEIMELWKKAERISKIPLRGIYWEGGENMDDTRRLQPALTVMNFSLWVKLAGRVKPAGTAGHSLGEYAALAAAGVLSFEDVLQLVTLRGRLMAEADPDGAGGMAAIVKLDQAEAEALVDAVRAELDEEPEKALRITNFNTPSQFVASGSKKAVEALVQKARERKARALPLAVSGAFHSPYMAGAAKEMAVAIGSCDFVKARFPLYSNASGRAATDGGVIKEQLLRQMTAPVYWVDTIRNMFADGLTSFVECSPKNVLGKMAGQILAEHEGEYSVRTVSGPADLAGWAAEIWPGG